MKLRMNTDLLHIITPDTYGTEFQYYIRDDCWDDFKNLMMDIGADYLREALKETIFENATLSNFSFHSPREYNFTTDWFEFDMEFDDNLIGKIREMVNDEFFDFAYNNYHSRDGFISFMPYRKDDYYKALEDDKERAIAMFIVWQFSKENNLEKYQDDYIMDVWERASGNGYEIDYEEECLC